MKLRSAHVALLMLAAACVTFAQSVIRRGLAGDPNEGESTLWNHVAYGGALSLLAAVLVGFVLYDAHRSNRVR